MGDAKQRPGFYEATLATKSDERVRPTDDTSGKSNGVSGEGEGGIVNVGSGRDDEGSSSEEDSDEEMVAEEHVESSAVAGEEPDRDQEDLPGDEEAPVRNVRNPKDPLPEEIELHNKRGHLPYRAWCPVFVNARGREDQHEAKELGGQSIDGLLLSWRDEAQRTRQRMTHWRWKC